MKHGALVALVVGGTVRRGGPVRGKYLVVWRREPDSWKIQLDMWNSGPERKP
jgi:ketosteroid isomerase-like protein